MRNSSLVLLVCAGLLLSGGAILGGSAGWSILRMSYYFWTSDFGVEFGAGVQLVAGAVLCLPACWLATLVPYHPRTLSLLATLMFLTTAAMLILCTGLVSLSALSGAAREPAQLNASMLRALSRAQYDPSVRSAFSSMQIELRCCGVHSSNDWFKHRRTLPAACCNRFAYGKLRDVCEVPVFTSGCLQPALLEIRYYVNAMAVLTSVIIITLSVTLFATAYTLVAGVLERGELRALKTPPGTLRVACLHAPAAPASFMSPYPPAPAVAVPAQQM